MPLLTGTDGKRKMSKSFGNYVGVNEPPDEIYGKTLSIPDSSLETWYSLLIGAKADPGLVPRDSKRALARALVERFHGVEQALAAEAAFDSLHIHGEIPDDVPEVTWSVNGSEKVHMPALLAQAFGVSTSEARRSLGQGGVKLDGEPLAQGVLDVAPAAVDGRVLQLASAALPVFASPELRGSLPLSPEFAAYVIPKTPVAGVLGAIAQILGGQNASVGMGCYFPSGSERGHALRKQVQAPCACAPNRNVAILFCPERTTGSGSILQRETPFAGSDGL